MNQAARRIGRTLALVLPIVLVLSGTLAVARVPWSTSPSESPMRTAAFEPQRSAELPPDVLTERLLRDLRDADPGVALTHLEQAVDNQPSLARHCAQIARTLGRAAVNAYGAYRARAYSRPVCDTSFASGIAQQR